MKKEHIMNTYGRFDATFVKGSGTKVYDAQGKVYLDFVSGVAVNCLGHSHPAIAKTLADQSQTLIHVSNLYWNDKQLMLAEKLAAYSDHHQVFFSNSGSEAVETGLKLARKYGKIKGGSDKNVILYMENSFHGRTLGALAVTGQEKYQKDFMPLMQGLKAVKFNDPDDLEKKMDDTVCGVILEPIQGEGGIITVSPEFLQKARNLCDQYQALLIFDEVQCGIGRTGKLFAYENFTIQPDVICMAKGLGGGFPIGATLAKKEAAQAFVPGDHGCTFGGNPLACAVALTVLEELMEKGVLENTKQQSVYIMDQLSKLQNKYPVVQGVQGMGLMLGLGLNIEGKHLVQKCFEKGLLLVGAGEKVVRILPPLNVTQGEIDKAIAIIEAALKEL
ncbi:aspartate aminotransferase family protein [Geosporobacter ferrireducens]|uniref:Acetylornithine aminotransferase n=1 Tax=Geosporobacter ferrireducens TaxID=1424294 RepID=A0A1D8GHK2_9FIRM|nr:aspartate aminotransferase family protein [Geosporobacter ferrireducens]AOT70395.1 acetylornithine aminotransferase [Geosporobacter ferrireducens]MTI57237.1 aspartate aminotransferase family protein [Geosporobacter ferrireducens]